MTESRTRSLLLAVARRPWAVVAVAALIAGGFWAAGTREHPHGLRVAFSEALDLVPGMDVRVRGANVGRVSKVDLVDGRPAVELGIDDNAWPLHSGTRALLRWGSTLGLGERRVDLLPGAASNPAIPEGGVIPSQDAVVPTEFDQVFQTLDAPTRRNLQDLLAAMHGALRGRARAVGAGVANGSRALAAAGGVLRDLAADPDALDALVHESDRMVHTLAVRSGRIRNLVSVAAATFDTLGHNAGHVQRTISVLPGTLRASRPALARLETSLGRFRALMAALAPGARRLPPVVRRLRVAVGELRLTAPRGVTALRALRRAAPGVEDLLRRSVPLVRELQPAMTDALPVLSCLRPYAPELAGVISNWAGYTSNYDGNGHYARVAVALGAPTAIVYPSGVTTQQFTKLTGVEYMGLRPPGWLAGRRDFSSQCGTGPGVVDPRNDWDDRR